MACGADFSADGGVRFRVWAPAVRTVEVLFEDAAQEPLTLSEEEGGYFSGHSPQATAGTLYRYRLNGDKAYPDPYSRFQPKGPHGPSQVVDPSAYRWQDADWRGIDPTRQVIYELHIGTFTKAGTYDSAAAELPALKALGVTCIELMPVAEFAGRHGWGYDGVDLFAPYHHYGDPDALRRFIDRAHAAGLGVILDVVYNHVGTDGNYLPHFTPEYFTDRHANDWGQTINYYCEAVRQLAIDNAAYWIREFHFDGLRIDAAQSIHDPDSPRLLATMTSAARAAAQPRTILISAEDYEQRADLLRPIESGGAGLDCLWNDDFHHASRVALTGNRGGYFAKYSGSAQELLSALRHGFLFQGQYDAWRKTPRGSPALDRPQSSFIAFTQNHDQVANTLYGVRLAGLTSPGRSRAITAALLLGPHTPLLFMGQEFDAPTPFAYFADYQGSVAQGLWAGRKKELTRFEQYADPAAQDQIMDPSAAPTLEASRLDCSERDRPRHRATYRLYQDLLRLRREDPVLNQRPHAHLDGAVLGDRAFVLRWFDETHGDRLLLVNLGGEMGRASIAEPLLAPPRGRRWTLEWSSDHPDYRGMGTIEPVTSEGWHVAAEAASFLVTEPE